MKSKCSICGKNIKNYNVHAKSKYHLKHIKVNNNQQTKPKEIIVKFD